MNYIFFSGNILERAGGPSTYLHNLKEGLKETENSDKITFIYNKNIKNENFKKYISKHKKMLIDYLPRVYEQVMIKHLKKTRELGKNIKNINDIDLIHFHLTLDLSKYYNYLPNNTIKILTSHCPEMPCVEFKNSLKAKNKNTKYDFNKAEKYFLEEIDKRAFNEADVLIFPSKEAMEPYYETYPEFDQLIKGKKIKYLMTGTKKLNYTIEKDAFRSKYKIPKDAFILSFVGRHNEVKGYDNFIKIAESLLKRYKDMYVITAGIGNIESPTNRRWIDIGWTNDPGSVINSADVFILPNKRTYFDLILLEVLSIGKVCVVSNTGGNKTVERLSEGIKKYDNIEQAKKIIEDIYMNKERMAKMEEENIEIYNKYFTVGKFTENYIKLIEEIRKEGK